MDDAKTAEQPVQPVAADEPDRAVGERIIALRVLCEVEHWGVEKPPSIGEVPFLLRVLHRQQRVILGKAWGLDGNEPMPVGELAKTITDKTTAAQAKAMVEAAVARLRMIHRANTGQAAVPIPPPEPDGEDTPKRSRKSAAADPAERHDQPPIPGAVADGEVPGKLI